MELTAKMERGRMTFFFNGEIDEFRCRTLRGELDREIAAEAPDEVVFDMGGVSFVDSTGLGLILGRFKRLDAVGSRLMLRNVPPQVDKVFRASGVYSVVEKVK